MNQAHLYVKYNGLQKSDAEYILDNYLRLIKFKPEGGDTILDIGCGSGDVTTTMLMPKLPEKIKRLTGSDISEDMIEFAKRFYSYQKVDFVAMDIECKEIPVDLESEYDHIFSFYCLHWIQNQKQALKNMNELLKPGGDMLLTFLASNPIFNIYETLASNEKWSKFMSNYKNYVSPYQKCDNPERAFEKLLTDVGFACHLCKVVDREYIYNDIKTLRKSIIAVSPFKIPENLQNDYLSDYITEIRNLKFVKQSENNKEIVRVPYKLFVVVASKNRNK